MVIVSDDTINAIVEANEIADKNLIFVGEALIIPTDGTATYTESANTTAAASVQQQVNQQLHNQATHNLLQAHKAAQATALQLAAQKLQQRMDRKQRIWWFLHSDKRTILWPLPINQLLLKW